MKIVITQFISLDGVSQGPGSASEDPSGGFLRGGWFVPYLDNAFVRQASEWLDRADGLLLGRRTTRRSLVTGPRSPSPIPSQRA